MRFRFIIFLVAVFSAFFSSPTDAQFSVGINAGVTRMKFSGDPPDGIGFFVPKPGASSGLRLEYRFNDAFALSIQPGISRLRSNYKVMNDSGTAVVDSTQFTLNSFSLPVHAVVWSENGRFYIIAGFEFDYTLDFKGDVLISQTSITYEVADYNIYAQFGAGFIIPLGKPFLSFELRYSQGLVNFSDALVHQDSFFPRTKLTNTNFLLGFHLPLGKSDVYKLRKNR